MFKKLNYTKIFDFAKINSFKTDFLNFEVKEAFIYL